MANKILIIGASGMFGTAISRVCKKKRADYLEMNHEDLEISDKGQLEEKIEEHEPKVIINSAAMMGIKACEEDPLKAFEINAIAPMNLAKICNRKKIILVQISSNAVFDGSKPVYAETDIPSPKNTYGLSKYAGEMAVQNNLNESYIIRFPKLFGPRRNVSSGFTDKMIEKMRKGEEIRVADDRIDTFTYTVHAAIKLFDLLEANAPFGIYHIANKGEVSYYEFIRRLSEKIGYKGRIIPVKDSDFPAPAFNPLRVGLESNKIKDMPSFEAALEDYVAEGIRL